MATNQLSATRESWQGTSVKDFRVTAIIGKGGFGKVYKARHRRSGRDYALKVMNRKWIGSKGMTSRVENEIVIHASLRHRSVVRMHTHFQDEKFIYLVLDLCANGNLYRHLRDAQKSQRRISRETKIGFFKQIVEGVKYLHAQSVVHRDLKLSNLLLNDDMKINICDFGLAMRVQSNKSQRTVCGTVNYMAPEVAGNKPYNPVLADLWSLGCLLYSLLTNGRAISDKDFKSNLRKLDRHSRNMIKLLLNSANPQDRPSCSVLLTHPLFFQFQKVPRSQSARLQPGDLHKPSKSSNQPLEPIQIGNLRGVQHQFGSHLVQITPKGDVVVKVSGKVNIKFNSASGQIEHQGRTLPLSLGKKLPKFYQRVYSFAVHAVNILKSTTPTLLLRKQALTAALLPEGNIARVWFKDRNEIATYDLNAATISITKAPESSRLISNDENVPANQQQVSTQRSETKPKNLTAETLVYDLNDNDLNVDADCIQSVQDAVLRCLELQAQLEKRQWSSSEVLYFPLIIDEENPIKSANAPVNTLVNGNEGGTSVVVDGIGSGFQNRTGQLRLVLIDGTSITLDSSASIVTFDKEQQSFALVKSKRNRHLPILPPTHKSKLQRAKKIIQMMR